jgi:hypothetical protein
MRNRTDGQGMALLAESSSPSFDVISYQVTSLQRFFVYLSQDKVLGASIVVASKFQQSSQINTATRQNIYDRLKDFFGAYDYRLLILRNLLHQTHP